MFLVEAVGLAKIVRQCVYSRYASQCKIGGSPGIHLQMEFSLPAASNALIREYLVVHQCQSNRLNRARILL